MSGKTLSQKVWERHVAHATEGQPSLLFIDLHLIHEVTSPQAFDGLRAAGRSVHRPDLTIATEDHNVPTADIDQPIADPVSRRQVEALRTNCAEFDIPLYGMGDPGQGIVHVIGPEMGLTLPGMTVVCGDSHTSTHGAFGALAFGIGTSEVEHVLATQTLPQQQPGTLAVTVNGELPAGATAKDVILAIVGRLGTGGGIGSVIEYRGDVIRNLSMEGRMTVCNMAVEAGAKNGFIAADRTVQDYVASHNASGKEYEMPGNDGDAKFFSETVYRADDLEPMVAQPHSPDNVVPARKLNGEKIDRVYIGSCTGGKTADFVAAAELLADKTVMAETFVVPVTTVVEHDLNQMKIGGKSLRGIFAEAGAKIGPASCAACLGGPKDTFGRVNEPLRCVSTTNRNFPGRMGHKDAEIFLASPATAAASAITGEITDPRDV